MGAHLGMNCHERLAAECELKRLEEKLFIETQRHGILQNSREATEKIKITLHRILPADHGIRQAILGAHNLLVLECAVVSAAMHRIQQSIKFTTAQLAADDALWHHRETLPA